VKGRREYGWTIVVRKSISAQRVDAVLSGINARGRHGARTLLSTPTLFMRHLVLHELAHIENDWPQERENDCDVWAFAKLREL
jgi:hypothetical protein